MTEKEMLDYLLSTGLYEKSSERYPYSDLFYNILSRKIRIQ